MMDLRTAFPSVPRDFPNHLAGPSPERSPLGPTPWWLLVGLVLLCMLPRAVMAMKLASVCPDGVFYIRVAKALDEGRELNDVGCMWRNTFPLALLILNRAGLDWEVAGKLWGVILSSLAVLPLYGLARRQFNERVAVVACFLYAIHDKLIAWSPEVIREPTFWFFVMLSIYLLWRAVTEVRLVFFAAAGASMALAAATRVEGLFLLIPLAWWSLWRGVALCSGRGKLALGVVLCLVLFLTFPAPMDLAAGQYSSWISVQSAILQGRLYPSPAPAVTESAATMLASETSPPLSWARMIEVFVPTVVKGFTALVGLCVLTGLWGWRRTWMRRDHLGLSLLAMVTFASIWVHLTYARGSSTRFFLQIVLICLPCAALGLLRWCEWLLPLAERAPRRLRVAMLAAPWVLAVATGLGLALASDCSSRRGMVNLGNWLQRESQPTSLIFGSEGEVQVVNFYARRQCVPFPFNARDDAVVAAAEQLDPDLVLLVRTKRMTPARCQSLSQRMQPLGLRQVSPSQMPPDCEKLTLLVRDRSGLVWHGPAPQRR